MAAAMGNWMARRKWITFCSDFEQCRTCRGTGSRDMGGAGWHCTMAGGSRRQASVLKVL